MKIEDLVLTIEQMQHLQELGVEVKDTALVYLRFTNVLNENEIVRPYFRNDLCGSDVYTPALTLQEILEMLPEEIKHGNERAFLIYDKADDIISYTYEDYDGNLNIDVVYWEGDGMLTNAYNMLCWVLDNGYLNASNLMRSINKK